METKNKYEKYYTMARNINGLLLGTHILLFVLFFMLGVTLMVYVNVVSILLYLAMFCYYKNIAQYVAIGLTEVMIHMSLALICMGWDAGFQFYSFCLIPCIFMCDYMNRSEHRRGMHPIAVSVVNVMVLLGCRWYIVAFQPIYTIENSLLYQILFAYNMAVSFAFLVMYIYLFENSILQKEKMLENMAEMDELTKLPNRYLMQNWLTETFENSKKEHDMAIAMLDVDDFKNLNDVYGHNCGDYVLKTIAGKIRNHIPESTRSARWGGEGFLFLASGKNAGKVLYTQLENVRQEVEQTVFEFQGQKINVTITAGIIEKKESDRTFFETIERADQCMYEGKRDGKNRVVW